MLQLSALSRLPLQIRNVLIVEFALVLLAFFWWGESLLATGVGHERLTEADAFAANLRNWIASGCGLLYLFGCPGGWLSWFALFEWFRFLIVTSGSVSLLSSVCLHTVGSLGSNTLNRPLLTNPIQVLINLKTTQLLLIILRSLAPTLIFIHNCLLILLVKFWF